MQPFVDQHRSRIADLCRRYGVRSLELFGSASTEDFDPLHSDVDLLVEFQDASPAGAADRYFGLKEDLQNLLGRSVDLVMLGALRNPYVLRAVNRQRDRLYAA
ncbi:MAG: nucleotidyltransferase domain-containing protein [Stagnimonas sp.]|nr:nucleotidyltransferase domain-containing protein [Stagnimonas sp.]